MPAKNSKDCSKMNTNPDEATLALWLDDELHGDELAAVETWAAGQPDQIAARDQVRQWRRMIATTLPASEEPPYAELFSGRVARAIRESKPEAATVSVHRFAWQSWVMPLAACAGMVFAFWLGMKTKSQPAMPEFNVAGAPRAIPVEPILYTPDGDVNAEWFASSDASATVIVLNGVDAIPDDMDFSKTVTLPEGGEINSTADLQAPDVEKLGL
jgi:hypothetical protein